MSLLDDATIWADVGIVFSGIADEYVHAPKAFSEVEVLALLRAAYGAGYTDGLREEQPTPILRACQYAATLRLTLPLSS